MELFAIEIRTTQWQPMILWYTTALKLKSAVRSEEEGYALLAGRGWRLSLLQMLEEEVRDRSAISLALEVGDIEAARDHITTYLTEPAEAIETSDEGFRQWTIADPDGNRIKLFQFIPVD